MPKHTLHLRLYPHQYMGMAYVFKDAKDHWEKLGVPGWRLMKTGDLVILGFEEKVLKQQSVTSWHNRVSTRLYRYSLPMEVARALYEYMPTVPLGVVSQDFFSALILALVNEDRIVLPSSSGIFRKPALLNGPQ